MVTREERICTFDCSDMPVISRTVGQSIRSPIVNKALPPQAFSAHREDFKIGTVVGETIQAMKPDQACCEWNPGFGAVQVYDYRFYPGAGGSCSPAPVRGEQCWGARDTARAFYNVYNFTCQVLTVGTRVMIHRDALGGYWVVMPLESTQCHKRVRLTAPHAPPDAIQRYTIVDPPAPTDTTATVDDDASGLLGKFVTVFNSSGTSLGVVEITGAVYSGGGNTTALVWDPALVAAPDNQGKVVLKPEACQGPIVVEVLDYQNDDGGRCELTECLDNDNEPVTMEVFSTLKCTFPTGTEFDAVPMVTCAETGCCRYYLQDIRPHLIYGKTDPQESGIPGKVGNTHGQGDIILYDISESGVESEALTLFGNQTFETVFNGCSTPIDPNIFVWAELKDCIYSIIVVCCPDPQGGPLSPSFTGNVLHNLPLAFTIHKT